METTTPPAPEQTVSPDGDSSQTLVAELMPCKTAERKHHRYGPSKFNHLKKCAGFDSENSNGTEAAEKGTRSHDVMEETVRRFFAQPTRALELKDILIVVLQEVLTDEEDHELLRRCCVDLQPYVDKATDYRIEIGVTVPNFDDSEMSAGYFDVLLFFGRARAMLVDYKFGWLPVPPAPVNLQGKGYGAGVFRAFPDLEVLGIMFLQPKLHAITKHVLRRADIPAAIQEIRQVIDLAERVRANREASADLLHVNDACAYCMHKATCAAGMRETLAMVRRVPGAAPATFPALDKIETPEQAAAVRYALDTVEDFIEGVKNRAKEIAIANNNEISTTLPTGEEVRYVVSYQKADRQLADTVEIVDALKDIVDERQLLAAAKFQLGTLEDVVAGAIHENANLPVDEKLRQIATALDAQVAAGQITKTKAKAQLAAARRDNPKITKDEARQRFESLLEASALITRPEGTFPVLRRKKSPPKQLVEPKQ